MKKIKFIIAVVVTAFLMSCDHNPPILAGGEDAGFVDGVGENARFKDINSGTVDNDGNLYVIDNNLIRKITPDGKVSTILGNDKYFEAYSNDKLVKIDVGELNLLGFDLNQSIYFSNNSIYYKLSKDNLIIEFPETSKIKDEYSSFFIGFNSKSLDLYFEYPDSYGYFDYYYKFNLTTSKITKLFTRKRSFTLQIIFTQNGVGYQLFDSKISKVDENLNTINEIYSFYFRKSKEWNFGLVDTKIALDEKRNLLYIIDSGYYHRVYKLNLN